MTYCLGFFLAHKHGADFLAHLHNVGFLTHALFTTYSSEHNFTHLLSHYHPESLPRGVCFSVSWIIWPNQESRLHSSPGPVEKSYPVPKPTLGASFCYSLLSLAVINSMTKINLGKKRLCHLTGYSLY